MMRTVQIVALFAGFLFSVTAANAACTQADMTAKATDLQAALTAKIQQDPSKAQELSKQMQDTLMKYAGTNDVDAACKAYDDLLALLKQ